jgi:hypothetical protein
VRGIAGLFLVVGGGISVLVILYQYFSLNQEFNQSIGGMVAQKLFSYSFGAHGALLGSVVVAGGGLIDVVMGKKPPAG